MVFSIQLNTYVKEQIMSKMSKKEQYKLAIDFHNIQTLAEIMSVQDIMNTKALDEYDEPKSYSFLYRIDDLTQQLLEIVQKYLKALKDEQKIIVDLENLIHQ